jgi:hypothetical protein
LKDFSIADIALLDAEYGLTFINLENRLLVTIPIDKTILYHFIPQGNCIRAGHAVLEKPTKAGKYTKGSVHLVDEK